VTDAQGGTRSGAFNVTIYGFPWVFGMQLNRRTRCGCGWECGCGAEPSSVRAINEGVGRQSINFNRIVLIQASILLGGNVLNKNKQDNL